MPYTICTYDGPPTEPGWTLLSRRAVDDHTAACRHLVETLVEDLDLPEHVLDQAEDLPLPGGRIELASGSCIEVTHVTWGELAALAGLKVHTGLDMQPILDAYNAGA